MLYKSVELYIPFLLIYTTYEIIFIDNLSMLYKSVELYKPFLLIYTTYEIIFIENLTD